VLAFPHQTAIIAQLFKSSMGRRKRVKDWIGLVAQLTGFVVLFSVIFPQVRQAIFASGFIAMCFFCLAVVGFIGFTVYRFATHVDWRRLGVTVSEQHLATYDLLEQLCWIDWFQFEKLVARVYQKLGYAVTRCGGANPDGGIDLIIEKDGQRTAVQCKQWKTRGVGQRRVRKLLDAMTHAQIEKGISITLLGCTGEAEQHKIEIVDRTGLSEILDKTDAISDPQNLALLKRKWF